MLRSSIDLGTNTCLLLVAEWDPQARQVARVVSDHSTIVRLGEGVDRNREFAPQAMERTLKALEGYSKTVREAGLDPAQTVCVATSQARDVRNGAQFFEEIQSKTGFRFQVISGEEEARFTFLGGLLPGMDPARSAVIDIGGGSTEYMASLGGQSLDIGSVRFTERFLKSDPVSDDEFWAAQEAMDSLIAQLEPWRASLSREVELVAVAGTATTLAAWHLGLEKFDAQAIDQVTLTRGDVHRMVEELKWRTVKERCELPGMEPKRADVLLAGAMILWRSMELLGFKEAKVSTRGLRFGALSLA